MSLKIKSWKKNITRSFWGVFTILIAGFFIRVVIWENHYYQSKEGSPRAISATESTGPEVDETEPTLNIITEHSVAPKNPRYLTIPKIGVDHARIFAVGLKPNNEISTPSNIFDVGWYDASGKPGQGDTIVLDGHNGGPSKVGVFKYLPVLSVGDIITIERGDGKIFSYEVFDNVTIPLSQADDYMATAFVSPVPRKESLSLITCTGEWSATQKTYLSRQFVRAVFKN